MKKQAPLISVCIPVFETGRFLQQCLRSVIRQDFVSFEVVIVSDASRGTDENGRNAKKIVKAMQKEGNRWRKEKSLPSVDLRFIEHHENRGLVEVRRTLCYESRGVYITQLDSDDELEAGALSALHSAAEGEGNLPEQWFDIVHGTSTAGTFNSSGEFTPAQKNLYGEIFYGTLLGRDILDAWIMKSEVTSNTWGKLIKRDVFLRAYENIPYTECNLAEDALLFFFISQFASSYIGIKDKVYRYRINSGMTAARKINSLQSWKMICSSASVFTVISEWIKENHTSPIKMSDEEIKRFRLMMRWYLENALNQLHIAVIPELKEKAHAMLCDYWGAGFVEKIEKLIDSAEN
jgi:glycosyltransferase involved in cell wall biosynthesis